MPAYYLEALTVALGGLAACSDDDEATTATTDETTNDVSTTVETGVGSSTISAEACDAFADLGAAMTGDPAAAGPAIEAFEENVTGAMPRRRSRTRSTVCWALTWETTTGQSAVASAPSSTPRWCRTNDCRCWKSCSTAWCG